MIDKMKKIRIGVSILACLLLCLSIASCRTPASTRGYCQSLVKNVLTAQESSFLAENFEDSQKAGEELSKAYKECSSFLKNLTIVGTTEERILALDMVVYSKDSEAYVVLEKVLDSLTGSEKERPVLFAAIVALKNSENPPRQKAAKLAVNHMKGGKRNQINNVTILKLLVDFSPEEALTFVRSITDQEDLSLAAKEWPLPAFVSVLKKSKHAASIAFAKDLEKRLSALPENSD